MASVKSTALVVALLLLNCHWAQCQFYGGPGFGGYGGYPIIANGYDNDRDIDTILPLLILAFSGRGGGFGGYGGYGGGGCRGCGGGCGGGCGCGGCGGC